MIKVDLSGAAGFWGDKGPDWAECEKAHRTLAERSGAGADFTGWLELPDRMLSGDPVPSLKEYLSKKQKNPE